MFSHCPFVFSFVCSSGQIWLPWYLMNGFSILDVIYREYSPASSDDLITFWGSKVKDLYDLITFCRSKIKVTAGH